jgi:predicted glycosyltransferase
MFFKPAIDVLQKSEHQIICTSRKYREAIELARIKQINLKVVGKHGGAQRHEKLRESAYRIFKLTDIIKSFDPDIAISFSSPEACRVAFGLGIRSIAFNDSPHAEAVARLTGPLIDLLLCPWIIPYSAWARFGIQKKNILRYKALDPIAWLSKYSIPQALELSSFLSQNKKESFDIDKKKKTVLIRMEETKASYIADKKLRNSVVMIDELVNSLSNLANFIILCRYNDQINEVSKRYKGKAYVISNVLDGISLLSQCDVFVGAGGTMTTEASLLGKPTISIAPIRFYVEKYLVSSGLAERASSPKQLVQITRKMIINGAYAKRQEKRSKHVIEMMEDPIQKLLYLLGKYA